MKLSMVSFATVLSLLQVASALAELRGTGSMSLADRSGRMQREAIVRSIERQLRHLKAEGLRKDKRKHLTDVDTESSDDAVDVVTDSDDASSGSVDVDSSDVVTVDDTADSVESTSSEKVVNDVESSLAAIAAQATTPPPAHKAKSEKKEIGFVGVNMVVQKSDNQELDALEQSVLNLAKQGLTPQMRSFVDQIRAVLNTRMKKDIESQYNSTDRALIGLVNKAALCSVRAGTTPSAYNMPSLYKNFKDCHASLQHKKEMAEAMGGLQDSSKDLMNEYCQLHAANESKRNAPRAQQCQFDGNTYTGPDRILNFMQDQRDFWDGVWKVLKYSRERCENVKRSFAASGSQAGSATNAGSEADMQCHLKQVSFETSSCEYKKAADLKFKQYDDCYTSAATGYSTAFKNATLAAKGSKSLQQFLQAQMISVLRINCYLSAMESPDSIEAINRCQGRDYFSEKAVVKLAFRSRPMLPKKPAPHKVEDTFCKPEFVTKYYSSLGVKCNVTCS
eukprot:TRINITY_DN95293_c0_g1_i1.p1 TRINITY_DN95293_c0_g1~~TRINITY_DN95293_c0_g1_i1.p1  ORF type:complete len:506 (-),score=120.85 TRINITY_DN95293_c0_g1_i1:150-1667(-)